MTVYQNEQEMLALAQELVEQFKREGNDTRAAMYARKVEQHKAALAKYEQYASRRVRIRMGAES